MNKVILGSHVPFTKSNRYYLGAVETTILNNANALMVYTGPPQRSLRVDEKELEIPAAQLLAKKHHLDFNHFVVHAPYIINLASNQVATRKFSIDFLVKEIQRTHSLGIKKIVLHPGFALGHPTMDQAISTLVHSLQQVINQVQQLGVKICLETMAGKGSEIGFRLEQLGQIIAGCAFSPVLGVCLDTCHLHDAGYDLGQKKTILSTIQRTFGLDRVEVLHINDSSYPLGARKDRHANIGYGHIGFDNLLQWIYEPIFSHLPKILETPFYQLPSQSVPQKPPQSLSPYKLEIALIRSRQWKNIFPPGSRLVYQKEPAPNNNLPNPSN